MKSLKFIIYVFAGLALFLLLSNAERSKVQTYHKYKTVMKTRDRVQFSKIRLNQENKKSAIIETSACPKKCVCSNNGLVNCSRLGFTAVPSLPANATSLDLSGNDITYLPDNSFSYPNLQNVDLSGNHLNDKSFTTKTFFGTKVLTKLDLGFNAFTSVPSHLPKEIETLWFYNSNIKDITSQLLTPYANLTYLDLSQNRISAVPTNLNDFFPRLNHFDVSFNHISTIYNATFNNTIYLQYISLRFNKLTEVPTKFPPFLRNLDLVGNPITQILPNTFIYLPELETLSMWESSLTTIHDYAFSGLDHVTILDLMECHVTSPITNYTFHGLNNVETIDISLSNISVMERAALRGLNKLQTLWLNDNPFKTLDPQVFNHNTIPSISEIYLWGNSWNCDCKLKWLKEMQEESSVIQDPRLMTCAEPTSLKGKTWDNLHSSQFVC